MALRAVSSLLSGVAVLALVVLQFVPWANVEQEGGSTPDMTYFGYTVEGTTWPDSEARATTWNLEYRFGERESDMGWYSDEVEGDDGPGDGLKLIRVAIPFLLAGLAAALVGGLLILLMRGIAGPVTALVGGALLAVGTAIFANGVDEVFDGSDYTWLAGLYLAVAACALTLAAGVVGLLGRDEATVGSRGGVAAQP